MGEKIFAGCDEDGARVVVSFKLEMSHAFAIAQAPGFWPAPYVGHKGWVSMDATHVTDWDEVRALIQESYRLIAPKRSLAKLAGEGCAKPTGPTQYGATGARGPRRAHATRAKAIKASRARPAPPA